MIHHLYQIYNPSLHPQNDSQKILEEPQLELVVCLPFLVKHLKGSHFFAEGTFFYRIYHHGSHLKFNAFGYLYHLSGLKEDALIYSLY